MQPYDCPTCHALEGERHYDQCPMAGYKVELRYNPFDWAFSEALLSIWLKRNKHIIERVDPRYLVVNAADGTRAIGADFRGAYAAYCGKYGPAPIRDRHIIGLPFPA